MRRWEEQQTCGGSPRHYSSAHCCFLQPLLAHWPASEQLLGALGSMSKLEPPVGHCDEQAYLQKLQELIQCLEMYQDGIHAWYVEDTTTRNIARVLTTVNVLRVLHWIETLVMLIKDCDQ